jgi:hypothetical protein
MLAMQYSIALPADYDMAIIRRRIAEKGALLDGFPGLGFKAYLYALREEDGPSNLYAPWYLWQDVEGMRRFLFGDGFATLARSFGRPPVQQWTVLHAAAGPHLREARWATRETRAVAPGDDLAALRDAEVERGLQALQSQDALALATGCNPQTWELMRFRLWAQRPATAPEQTLYRVGYVAMPR